MIRPELDALLQGALDNTLTPEERDRLGRLMTESPEARARAAQLGQLNRLLDSLGPAEAPVGLVHDVLAQISNQPRLIHLSAQRRGTPVNKKILFGLAAAAAVVLAVITYSTNPPATEGTEATIGAAQRAQAPQIAPSDVKLGDTSAQDVLQTETFDAIMKDETLRTMLQDPNVRASLQDAELKRSLSDDNIRRALADPELARRMQDQALVRALDSPELMKKFDDASIRVLLANRAFADALRRQEFRTALARKGAAAALAGAAFQRALRDRNFDAAMRGPRFAEAMARGRQ